MSKKSQDDARDLNTKQRRFIEEYCVDFNATQAAIRSGYSARSAGQQAYDLLKKPEIQSAVLARTKELVQLAQMSALDVVTGLARIASSNILDYFSVNPDGMPYIDLSAITREQAFAVQSIETDEYLEKVQGEEDEYRTVKKVKLKLEAKKPALDTLAKYHGLLLGKRGGAGDAPGRDVDLLDVDEEELLEEIVLRRKHTKRRIPRA